MRRSSRSVCALIVAVTGTVQLTIGQVAQAEPAAAKATAGSDPQAVIVVLNDQLASAPPTKADSTSRRNQATSAQDAVLNRLPGAKPTKVTHFSLGNAFSATVTAEQAAALAK